MSEENVVKSNLPLALEGTIGGAEEAAEDGLSFFAGGIEADVDAIAEKGSGRKRR